MGRRGPRRAHRDAGFSVIELAVLGFIMLILGFVAITVYLNQRDKAVRVSAVTSITHVASRANAAYGDEADGYPAADELASDYEGELEFVAADAPSTHDDVVSVELSDDGTVLILAVRGGPWCYYLRTTHAGAEEWRHRAASDRVDCTASEFRIGDGDGW
jgi:type II secretory pathway pseudopilin PulG